MKDVKEKKKKSIVGTIIRVFAISILIALVIIVIAIGINQVRVNYIIDRIDELKDKTYHLTMITDGCEQNYYNSKDARVELGSVSSKDDILSYRYYDKNHNIAYMIQKDFIKNQNGYLGEPEYIGNVAYLISREAFIIDRIDSFTSFLQLYSGLYSDDNFITSIQYGILNYFMSAKTIRTVDVDGKECYEISFPIARLYSNTDTKVYVEKETYLPVKSINIVMNGETTYKFDFNVDESVFEEPDLSEMYVTMY